MWNALTVTINLNGVMALEKRLMYYIATSVAKNC